MAMKRCPACGGKVSGTAQACLHCGEDLAARRSWWWALAIVVSMAIAAIVSLSTEDPVQPVVVAQPRLQPEALPVHDLPEIQPDEVVNVSADYRYDVARMLNSLRREHPACRRELKPYNAGPSVAQSDPANPRFFAQCGGMHKTEVIHFTWMDAVNGRLPAP